MTKKTNKPENNKEADHEKLVDRVAKLKDTDPELYAHIEKVETQRNSLIWQNNELQTELDRYKKIVDKLTA